MPLSSTPLAEAHSSSLSCSSILLSPQQAWTSLYYTGGEGGVRFVVARYTRSTKLSWALVMKVCASENITEALVNHAMVITCGTSLLWGRATIQLENRREVHHGVAATIFSSRFVSGGCTCE